MSKKNDKGFSLVELLVALAIASIVLVALFALISNSTRSFRKQTISAQLQNDADITLNQLETDILQTRKLNISKVNNSSGDLTREVLTLATATKDPSTGSETISPFSYEYRSSDKTIYLVNGTLESVVCQNVDEVKIELDGTKDSANNDNLADADKTKFYGVKITIKLSNMNETREVTRVVYTRNALTDSMFSNDTTTE